MYRYSNKKGSSTKIADNAIFFYIYKKIENNSQKLSFTWYHKSIESNFKSFIKIDDLKT